MQCFINQQCYFRVSPLIRAGIKTLFAFNAASPCKIPFLVCLRYEGLSFLLNSNSTRSLMTHQHNTQNTQPCHRNKGVFTGRLQHFMLWQVLIKKKKTLQKMCFYATIITCFVPSLSLRGFVAEFSICQYSGLKNTRKGQFRFFLGEPHCWKVIILLFCFFIYIFI